MAKTKEAKKVLERTYNVPLRKEWIKVPRYKRAKKAVKALKEFIIRNMKPELDEKGKYNIKILKYANLEIWKHGIKNPPHHIKVNTVKDEKGKVLVELEGKPMHEEAAEKEKKKEAEKQPETKEEKLEEKRKETVKKEAEEAKKIEKEEITEERKDPNVLPHNRDAELKGLKEFKSEKSSFKAPRGKQGISRGEHKGKSK
jgi:large subunit ribosomal protein L31e